MPTRAPLAEKESRPWVTTYQTVTAAARRMTQNQLVVLADRKGDRFELFAVAQHAPPNLQLLIRAPHDRNLASQQHLWACLAQQPATTRTPLPCPAAGASKNGTACSSPTATPRRANSKPPPSCNACWPAT